MWILILTMTSSEAPAIAQVPGFTSEAACQFAGAAWKGQAQEMRRNTLAVFVCTKTST